MPHGMLETPATARFEAQQVPPRHDPGDAPVPPLPPGRPSIDDPDDDPPPVIDPDVTDPGPEPTPPPPMINRAPPRI